MKFLYASLTWADEQTDDVIERIISQVKGVSQLGNEAHYAYVQNEELVFCQGEEVTRYQLPAKFSKQEKFLSTVICEIIEKNQYDYTYLRGALINQVLLNAAICAHEMCFGGKVIFEPLWYPERTVCRRTLQQLIHKFAHNTNSVTVFGTPVETVWGIPAITVENGICVNEIRRRNNTEVHGDPISVLAVVEDAQLCGFDRIVQGMDEYRKNIHRDPITFDIIGSNADVSELKELVNKYDLNEYIHFLGEKTVQEMFDLYDTHSVAVASLGLYRADKIYYSSKITKQFCAAGIPFVYAYEDLSLDDNIPFALKLANNNSPLNIALVSEFVWRCRLDTRLSQTERKFAEKYYDWRIIMKRILEFTATGKRE